jgi:hypothetical protein
MHFPDSFSKPKASGQRPGPTGTRDNIEASSPGSAAEWFDTVQK